jgi:replicative DNA helicase
MRVIRLNQGRDDIPNFEAVLITRILETADLKTAIKRKITEDTFLLPDTRIAYAYLVGHYREYGGTPSVELFRAEFPEFPLHTTTDPVAVICDRIRANKLHRDLSEMLEEGVRLNREDSWQALDHFRETLAGLTAQHILSNDLDLTKTTAEAMEEYRRVKAGHGMLGIPWPWQPLNDASLGIQDEELIFIYARPKALKTFLMIAAAVHAFRNGHRPLFITREMPTAQIRRRVHAVWAALDYHAIRQGKLTPQEERAYTEDLEAFSELPPFILSGDDEGGAGVTALGAKIQEYDPDIVFVDGVYLMHDDRGSKKSSDWQAISNIMQDLKQLARQKRVPIIGTTQANRMGERTKGSTLSEIAFSDGIAQSADYVIRVIYDKRERDNQEAILTLPGIRESAGCTFTINARVCQDFSVKWVPDTVEEQDEVLSGTDEGVIR